MARAYLQVDKIWDELNEYNVNAKLRAKCLPPVVVKYGEFSDEAPGDDGGERDTPEQGASGINTDIGHTDTDTGGDTAIATDADTDTDTNRTGIGTRARKGTDTETGMQTVRQTDNV